MPPFPISAPAFKGNSRVVAADSAFVWLRYGWALFLGTPGVWAALTAIAFVVLLCLCFVPWLGTLLASLLLPVIGAALLHVCQKIANDQVPVIADLLAGFRQSENTGKLLLLGVFFMVAIWIISHIVAFFAWGHLTGFGAMGGSSGFAAALGGVLLAMLLLLVFSVPLFMAMWFAPALVLFNNMSAPDALKASFEACLKNAVPLGVFGLIVMVLTVFSALPVGLGLLVLSPVLAGANYASYRDVFVAN